MANSFAHFAEQIAFCDGDDSPDEHETRDLYKGALKWWKRGFNVVPQALDGSKHPGVKWKEYQDRRITSDEVARHFPLYTRGVGFITGAISRVIVVESDGPEGEAVLQKFATLHGPLPETLTIRSGSGRGLHRHFKHPGYRVKTKANPTIKLDVKGDGGFCVLPPSRHKSGGQYEVVKDVELAELPEGLLQFIDKQAAHMGNKRSRGRARDDAQSEAPDETSSAGAQIQIDQATGKSDACIEASTMCVRTLGSPSPDDMREMLRFLAERNYFEHRQGLKKDAGGRITHIGWIECGMALKPAYGDEGADLWAETHIDERARTDAPAQWDSFAAGTRPRDVTIATIIRAAKDAGFKLPATRLIAPTAYVSHGPFAMDPDAGLSMTVRVGRGEKATLDEVWICAAFEILGHCRDPQGRAWGKMLHFKDADGGVHTRHVSDAALQGEPGTLCATLADDGLYINRSRQREFSNYVNGARVDARVTVAPRTGWIEVKGKPIFVLPDEAIGEVTDETVVLDTVAHGPYEVQGSLEDWQQGIGQLASGHALPVLMISAALAGPLAHLLGAEGGGIHVFGASSIGKSSLLQAAASVWGRGGTTGYLRTWRATANGLEGAAASTTDTCLILDELGVGEARDIAASIYQLSNGVGKARATRDGSLRDPKSWRVLVVSSGEMPVEAKLQEDHTRMTRAGQLVRFLDIAADRGVGFGAFDSAGSCANAGQLADAIKSAACTHYGTAGPEFVRRLTKVGFDKIASSGKRLIAEFVQHTVPAGASEQIVRAAKKFALIGLAGHWATKLGITPWAKGEARHAAEWAFKQWLDQRGGPGSHEERQAIEQVRLVIEKHGEARFHDVDGTFGVDVRDRLGWRKGTGTTREWWVPPQIWKSEFCAGLDPTFVARTLVKHGMLRRQDRKHLSCVVSIGQEHLRAYALTATVLAR